MTDELLIKFLLRETSLDEDKLVGEWIAADPANQKQFADMELIWTRSKNLEKKSLINENEAWIRFLDKKSFLEKEVKTPVKSLRQLKPLLKIAAVLAIITCSWLFYSHIKSSSDTFTSGKMVMVKTLPDGSELTINKNTEVSYSFPLTENERHVRLKKGEVFFKVSHNKEKPFVIDADKTSILVVGTSFNVKHTGETTEVIVETGIVRVTRGIHTAELHKGERVRVSRDGAFTVKQSEDQLYNYYITKQFVANNTPLWRLTEILTEAYKTPIVIEDPKMRNATLTTTFKNDSLDDIIKIVAETLNLQVAKKGNTIILK